MRALHRTLNSVILALVLGFAGCTSGGGASDSGGSNGGGSGGGTGGGTGAGSGQFTSDCGAAIGGKIKNPVDLSEGERVTAVATGGNVLDITKGDGSHASLLLEGIENTPPALVGVAKAQLSSLVQGGAILFDGGCDSTSGTTQIIVGSLYTLGGQNIGEELIKGGVAYPAGTALCEEGGIISCYESIQADSPPYIGAVQEFLWKAVSASDGGVVTIVAGEGFLVFVNGQELRNTGSGSNTISRGGSCGSYGAPVVTIKDTLGRPWLFPGGEKELHIPNACADFRKYWNLPFQPA